MKHCIETFNRKFITTNLDCSTEAQLPITTASLLGYVRVNPRKQQIKTPMQNSKRKKHFVSPIDKLLKKNGSIIDTYNAVEVNVFVGENHNMESKSDIHMDMKVSSSETQLVEEIPSMNVDHTSDEMQGFDCISPSISIKSPSAFSMDSAKGSSIINYGNYNCWNIGDLFWGQICNYCYWPCIVCTDPNGKGHVMESSMGNGNFSVHVRFFADNGRHNWVKRENLLPFINVDSYVEQMEEVKEKFGPKSIKYKVFVPIKRMECAWYQAIAEASLVAEQPNFRRMQKFDEILKQSQILRKLGKQNRRLEFRRKGNVEKDDHYLATQIKDEKCMSPVSPLYSPITRSVKRRKLSYENYMDHDVSKNTLENNLITNWPENSFNHEHIYNGEDFGEFFTIMKEFILEQYSDEILERNLLTATRNLWALKYLKSIQMEKQIKQQCDKLETTKPYIIKENSMQQFIKLEPLITRDDTMKHLSQRLKSTFVQIYQRQDLVEKFEKDSELAQKRLSIVPRGKKKTNRSIEEVVNDIFNLDSKYLFKGMNREDVCKYCFKPGTDLLKCTKKCQSWAHASCAQYIKPNINNLSSSSIPDEKIFATEDSEIQRKSTNKENFLCKECKINESPVCSVCHKVKSESSKDIDPLLKCSMQHCDRVFHLTCCKYWPQAKIVTTNRNNLFRCPCHVCHTCVSDNPKEKFHHVNHKKIVKCVKCPATYHSDSTCIPAGSKVLTAAYIICSRHTNIKSDKSINVNWCFICVKGGQLICCETCPIAVHAQCLKMNIGSNERYICEECESGRMPLYGELVWTKFNNFRWWPGIILPPPEVPKNISSMSHNLSEFVVRFFGSHNHGWVSPRRTYLYVEGDCSKTPKTRSGLDFTYRRAVEEAKRVYEMIKNKKLQLNASIANKGKLQPQPYIRIKTNRAVPPVKLHVNIENFSKCECKPEDKAPCGLSSNCLNRALYHECNPKICPAGKLCQNQMFESRISPRLEVVYTKERGFGLVSRDYIPAGTFVIEYVGEIINDDEFKARLTRKSNARDENFYFLSIEKDYIIDAESKGNLARFMNHSCDPNCETQKWLVNSINRVGIFAIKNILENTELTFNYLWDDLLGNEKKTCYCGSKNCSGQIGAKPKGTVGDLKIFDVNYKGVKIIDELNGKITRKRKRRRGIVNGKHKNPVAADDQK